MLPHVPRYSHTVRATLCLLFLVVLPAAPGLAEPPAAPRPPVAIRWWGQALVTIETWWNLRIAIDPYALKIGHDDPQIEADLVLVTHEHFDHANVDLIGGSPAVVRGLDPEGEVAAIDIMLDRPPNTRTPSVRPWGNGEGEGGPSPHAVRVRSIASDHDDVRGTERGRNAMFIIDVDGVRIMHCGDLGQDALTGDQLDAAGTVDVLLIPVGGVYTIDGARASQIVERVGPRVVVPIHYKTPQLVIGLETADTFLATLPDDFELHAPPGNTLAISADRGHDAPRVAVLSTRPWSMPDELARLFDAKERASARAQDLFRTLSVNQLNHRPGDGTHTPRWNAEHIAGLELGIFSEIYTAREPFIVPMNVSPAQMPPDYRAAHPDWTGEEEARALQRVQDYARRFAYLLDAADLDAPPLDRPPSSLRELLTLLAGHADEHVTNVQKKFRLTDWPAE